MPKEKLYQIILSIIYKGNDVLMIDSENNETIINCHNIDKINLDNKFRPYSLYMKCSLNRVFKLLREDKSHTVFIPSADVGKYGWNKLEQANLGVLAEKRNSVFHERVIIGREKWIN